jgi:hypothetical protein
MAQLETRMERHKSEILRWNLLFSFLSQNLLNGSQRAAELGVDDRDAVRKARDSLSLSVAEKRIADAASSPHPPAAPAVRPRSEAGPGAGWPPSVADRLLADRGLFNAAFMPPLQGCPGAVRSVRWARRGGGAAARPSDRSGTHRR